MSSEEQRMAGKFEIYPDKSGQYRFRLKSRNGGVVASGESYPTRAAAKKGIEAVKRAAAGAKVVDLDAQMTIMRHDQPNP